jgi:nicotinamidase-related amidase
MDLQVDFLDSTAGRMPVGDAGAAQVLGAARAVLSGRACAGALVVAIANAFRRSQVIGNLFRRNAALAGTCGADIDPRVGLTPEVPVFRKSAPSAFSNPELHRFLQSKGVTDIVLVGVFAEACVRATALHARSLDYQVAAPLDAIATSSPWKLARATRSMRSRGVLLPRSILEAAGTN